MQILERYFFNYVLWPIPNPTVSVRSFISFSCKDLIDNLILNLVYYASITPNSFWLPQ